MAKTEISEEGDPLLFLAKLFAVVILGKYTLSEVLPWLIKNPNILYGCFAGFCLAKSTELLRQYRRRPKSPPPTLAEADRRLSAYHEAGHVVTSWFHPLHPEMPESAAIDLVGHGDGVRGLVKHREKPVIPDEKLLKAFLVRIMGGREAERLFCQRLTAGGRTDLYQATDLAWDMVAEYGLVPDVGISFVASDNWLSEERLVRIEKAVEGLLQEAAKVAAQLLAEHREQVEKVAQALLARHELQTSDLKQLLGPIKEVSE